MKLRHLSKIFFISIILLSLYFIFTEVQQKSAQLSGSHLNQTESILIMLVCAVCYALNCLFLSYSWYRFLMLVSDQKIKFIHCNYIYSISSLGKYVPGSVFQYANRQMLGKNYNLSQANLLFASYMEAFGLLVSSGLLGIICFLSVQIDHKVFIFLSIIFSVLLLFILWPFFYKSIKTINYIKKLNWPEIPICTVLPVFLYYAGFFIITGLLLIFIISVEKQSINFSDGIMLISIWALAWLAGYVVVLAPAGLGVREAVLIAMLTPMFGYHMAIIVTVIFRISLVIGDVLFAGSGWLIHSLNLTKR